VDCLPLQIPRIETITDESSFAVGVDIGESGDDVNFSGLNDGSESDVMWSLFAGVLKKYQEFDLRGQDREWFKERVQVSSAWESLDLMDEIRNWGDWLDMEHRKKARKENNKFPKSNFKGSLMNWLKLSLRTVSKGENNGPASVDQETRGRKGWDLPSDYRIDIM
jgi:hypothetical protein